MTDQASFNDGGSRVDNQRELATILSLQALDGLSRRNPAFRRYLKRLKPELQ